MNDTAVRETSPGCRLLVVSGRKTGPQHAGGRLWIRYWRPCSCSRDGRSGTPPSALDASGGRQRIRVRPRIGVDPGPDCRAVSRALRRGKRRLLYRARHAAPRLVRSRKICAADGPSRAPKSLGAGARPVAGRRHTDARGNERDSRSAGRTRGRQCRLGRGSLEDGVCPIACRARAVTAWTEPAALDARSQAR